MKKAHIQTFGCQMNDYDSRRMEEILEKEGYEVTPDYANADLILLNTCSVRENPENKVYSQLGRLRRLKEKNPEIIIGVGGCVAQQEGENLLKREKCLNLVFGTDQIFQLPAMLQEVRQGLRVLNTGWAARERKIQNFIPDEALESTGIDGCKASIAITKGCDNHCTFCIVPKTRGTEVSREPENIIQEAKSLISKGAREITLLGQNVNSYRAGETGFYELLKTLADLEGLQRLRFTSPHPNDWNNALSDLMTEHPVICNQLHLPFQAGSDRILKLMRRGHTMEEYIAKVLYLKQINPGIEISTDLIVGFPGESEEEFEMTLKVMETVRFSQVYAFKYSPRPGTKAAEFTDNVPGEVKESRLQKVLDLHNQITSQQLDFFVGKTLQVLIDSAHPREQGTMSGRTEGNRPVMVRDSSLDIGALIPVHVTGRRAHSLEGESIASAPA